MSRYTRYKQILARKHGVHKIKTDTGLATLSTQDKNRHACQHWVHKIKTNTGLATLGAQDKNIHGPDNIGYTR
jgi:SOS response regulatory protein OraA/RecX